MVRCADAIRDIQVSVMHDPRRPTSAPVRRVTWWFRVACNPVPPPYETSYYEFSVVHEAGSPPTPLNGRFEVVPSMEPFLFHLRGPAYGDWCTTIDVEFADGARRRLGPFRSVQAMTGIVPIGVQVFGRRGENHVTSLPTRDSAACSVRR